MENWKDKQDLLKKVSRLSCDWIFEYIKERDRIIVYQISAEGSLSVCLKTGNWKKMLYSQTDPCFYEKLDMIFRNIELGKSSISSDFRMKIFNKKDEFEWISCRMELDEESGHYLGYIQKITEHINENLKFYEEARKDSLTKLLNKGHSEHMIKDAVTNGVGALMIIDIDNFKAVNDNLGHLFGDEVIVSVANGIKSVFRATDVVGRIGGDEFIVFVRDVLEKEVIRQRAEMVCSIVRDIYTGENTNVHISASIGIAIAPVDDKEYSELFKKADHALYYTKNRGKNGYTFYDADNQEMQKHHRAKTKDDRLASEEEEVNAEMDAFYAELNDLAFRLIEDTKDTDSAINLLIHKFNRKFGFGSVRILEISEEEYTLRCAYEVREKGVPSFIGQNLVFEENQWTFFHTICGENPYLCKEDSSFIQQNEKLFDGKTTQVLSIKCNNCFAGLIIFSDYTRERKITKKEKRILKSFGKIISVYKLHKNALVDSNYFIRQISERDSMTGLYQYEQFLNKIETESYNCPEESKLVYLYADITNFKYINETFGYNFGNKILKRFAKLLCEENKYLLFGGRPHSDNIVVVFRVDAEINDSVIFQKMNEWIHKMNEELSGYVPSINIQLNSGMYISSGAVKRHDAAIDNANFARKLAKERGDGNCVWFDEQMQKEQEWERTLVEEFPDALSENAFEILYEPVIDNVSKKVICAENVCCWHTSDGRHLKLSEFRGVLERANYMQQLDRYMLRGCCEFLQKNPILKEKNISAAVNLCRKSIKDDHFFEKFENLLKRYEISPQQIILEVDEEIFVSDTECMIAFCNKCQEIGVAVAMDAFGVGNSSLNVLDRLSVSYVKVDRHFIKSAVFGKQEKIILNGIVDTIKGLEKMVVFTGVETERQNEFICSLGCDLLQGAYYAKPLTKDEFFHYVEKHKIAKTLQAVFHLDGSYEDCMGLCHANANGSFLQFVDGVLPDRKVLLLPGGNTGHEFVELTLGNMLARDFTISLWFEELELQLWNSIFYADYEDTFISIIPRVWNSVDAAFRVMDKNEEAGFYDATTHDIVIEGWTHIAVVYNSKILSTAIFVNGMLAGYKNDVIPLKKPGRAVLGGDIYQPSFHGYVSELKITDKVMSAKEIEQEYISNKEYYQ